MRRFRLDIAYDGTAYAGWQIQPTRSTVQATLENVLSGITNGPVKIHGSGRTDQGVHARGQVAHTDLETGMAPMALQKALNALLPPDIRINRVRGVPAAFHARRSAISKEYRYHIWNAPIISPFDRHYKTHVLKPLDASRMEQAAQMLVGQHDFASFTANPNREVESTVRRLQTCHVKKRGHDITILAIGEGFLYKMVRSITGWLIRVGECAVEPETTGEILASRRRTARVPTAPPQGLFLWRVDY